MTDFMPDFDNMTQEQLNEWMESLARRQGATEGFTTAASMVIPEIDPSTVDQALLEDTYIPHGWSREQWEAQLKKEEAAKQRRAAAVAPAPPPAPPTPTAAPAASSSSALPMMSEQQLTEYIMSLDLEQQMELLTEMGKSQRGEPNRLAELLPAWDSSSVDESKLGKYRPGYMSEQEWEEYQAKEAARQQAVTPPISSPVADVSDVLKPPSLDDLFHVAEAQAEPLAAEHIQASYGAADPSFAPVAATDDPLQWLSQLGEATPEAATLPSLSLEALNQTILELPEPPVDDPLQWLSSLSDLEVATPEQPIDDLDTGVFNLKNLTDLAQSVAASVVETSDEITWLESLARATGADTAELVTAADMPLPPPSPIANDGPGYQPYSFEMAFAANNEEAPPLAESPSPELAIPDVSSFEDPELWLDAIAAGVNVQREDPEVTSPAAAPIPEDPMEVMRALNAGMDVPPEAVESFFEKMFERAEQMPDEPELADADAPPIEAEIPDWLRDALAAAEHDTAADFPVTEVFHAPSLIDDLGSEQPSMLDWQVEGQDAPDPVVDFELLTGVEEDLPSVAIPVWAQQPLGDMSDIFVDEDSASMELDSSLMKIDTDDPWVRAFAEESAQPEALEAWYQRRLAQIDPSEPAATSAAPPEDAPAAGPVGLLQPAQLPAEAELEHATPVETPAWLLSEEAAEPQGAAKETWFDTSEEPIPSWIQTHVEELTPADPLPDWLAGADVSNTEVPAWLLDTVEERQPADPSPVVELPAPVTSTVAVVERPAPSSAAPTRIAPVAAPAEVAAHLAQARQQITTDIDASLKHYEAVVRANAALNDVVQDLNRVLADKAHKNNPAVYRVLGDALMRQGKLQDALSTYRKALNLLG